VIPTEVHSWWSLVETWSSKCSENDGGSMEEWKANL